MESSSRAVRTRIGTSPIAGSSRVRGTVAQHEVEHDEVGRGLRRSSDRVVLARRGMDDEPRTHEVASHHRGDRGIILDDERRRWAGLLHLPLYASLQAAAILGPKP